MDYVSQFIYETTFAMFFFDEEKHNKKWIFQWFFGAWIIDAVKLEDKNQESNFVHFINNYLEDQLFINQCKKFEFKKKS